MTEHLVPALEQLANADATITGVGVLVLVLVALLLPERFKMLYTKAEFNRMREDRNRWRQRYDDQKEN